MKKLDRMVQESSERQSKSAVEVDAMERVKVIIGTSYWLGFAPVVLGAAGALPGITSIYFSLKRLPEALSELSIRRMRSDKKGGSARHAIRTGFVLLQGANQSRGVRSSIRISSR